MDRFSCMQVFVKAVELGSISAAAVELDLSSQVAGKHIRFLEQALEIKLLNRTTRQQSLTDAGRIYYEKAKHILAEMEEAEAFLAETRSTPRGKLRISAPVTFGNHALAPAITEFLKKYPEVGELYYSILRYSYLEKEKYKENYILEHLAISRSTYFRVKKEAINLLSTIIWGYEIPKVINMFEDNKQI